MEKKDNISADSQYNKMLNTPVWKLVTSLAVPTVISMLVTALYNMADTFFVSQISTEASAAVGIVFPIMSIIQAFGFTLGMGSGSLVSIKLGQKKNEEASELCSTAFFIAFGIGIIILFFGNLFADSFGDIDWGFDDFTGGGGSSGGGGNGNGGGGSGGGRKGSYGNCHQ